MKKALIIDDTKDSRLIVKTILNKLGFETLEAQNGNEGWSQIIKNTPNLIILDLNMPQKTGYELLQDIEEEMLGIPVVVISNDESANTKASCYLNGAKAVLSKPVLPIELQNAIFEMES